MVFGQTYENGVRVICTCEVGKFMQIPPSQRNSMAYVIKPSCPLHKPMQIPPPTEDFYFFKRKKKAHKQRVGTHIITPLSN